MLERRYPFLHFSTPSITPSFFNNLCNLDTESLLSGLDGIVFLFFFFYIKSSYFARLSILTWPKECRRYTRASYRSKEKPASHFYPLQSTPSLSTSSLTNTQATHLTVVSTPFSQLSLSAKIVPIRVLKHRKEVLLTSSKKE